MQELTTTLAVWEIWLASQARAFLSEREQVIYMATFLRDRVIKTWRLQPDNGLKVITWSQFTEILYGALENPEYRKQSASARIKEYRQKLGQLIQDLVIYIETIKKDFPYELNPVIRGHVLYDVLLPELQTEVIREAKEVTLRKQIFLIA